MTDELLFCLSSDIKLLTFNIKIKLNYSVTMYDSIDPSIFFVFTFLIFILFPPMMFFYGSAYAAIVFISFFLIIAIVLCSYESYIYSQRANLIAVAVPQVKLGTIGVLREVHHQTSIVNREGEPSKKTENIAIQEKVVVVN